MLFLALLTPLVYGALVETNEEYEWLQWLEARQTQQTQAMYQMLTGQPKGLMTCKSCALCEQSTPAPVTRRRSEINDILSDNFDGGAGTVQAQEDAGVTKIGPWFCIYHDDDESVGYLCDTCMETKVPGWGDNPSIVLGELVCTNCHEDDDTTEVYLANYRRRTEDNQWTCYRHNEAGHGIEAVQHWGATAGDDRADIEIPCQECTIAETDDCGINLQDTCGYTASSYDYSGNPSELTFVDASSLADNVQPNCYDYDIAQYETKCLWQAHDWTIDNNKNEWTTYYLAHEVSYAVCTLLVKQFCPLYGYSADKFNYSVKHNGCVCVSDECGNNNNGVEFDTDDDRWQFVTIGNEETYATCTALNVMPTEANDMYYNQMETLATMVANTADEGLNFNDHPSAFVASPSTAEEAPAQTPADP